MYLNRHTRRASEAGFSLLEMVVAIAILGIALGALYQAASGATRNVRVDEKYAYGVELAQSLLAYNGEVPESGVNKSGETAGGFAWNVTTEAIDLNGTILAEALLFQIVVRVAWIDGSKEREVVLHSVVEGRL